MLEVRDALRTVLRHAKPLPPSVSAAVPGRVLAEDVRADLDSPPFTKALMDGFAVRSADCPGQLRVVAEVAAGVTPKRPVGRGEAAAVFTGAPLPDGADAVVMQEHVKHLSDDHIQVPEPIAPGKNVLPRGTEMAAGDIVLPTGTVLTSAAVGLLAAVGRMTATTHPAPRVNVLATGSELVVAEETPGPGQIRNTNGPMLASQAARFCPVARDLGIGADDRAALTAYARTALATCDVLLLAGGVSVGKFDLVPAVLRDLGVESHFHKVRMKPGKPLLFGTRGDTLVFGLPGNPVSAFVCFELFVRPAIKALAGYPVDEPTQLLQLRAPLTASNDRPTFHPALRHGPHQVVPLPWFGSADLRALMTADVLLALPPGDVTLKDGDWVEAVILE